MSSARCLNWSRPPPGRHPALRKQVSCSEPSTSTSLSSPYTVTSSPALSSPLAHHHSVSSVSPRVAGPEDFCHQFLVTSAIIHTNRFQNYHTYDQARRGGSASLVRPRIASDPCGGSGAGGGGGGRGDSGGGSGGGRHRPASASVGQRTPAAGGGLGVVPERRGVLCKQLSLDQSILVQSSFTSGMATVASGGGLVPVGGEQSVEAALLVGSDGERSVWGGFNRKPQRIGAGTKNDSELVGSKKGAKPGGGVGGVNKDSRINIKIFLGQTVQQDSSDTGVSDTEAGGNNGNGSPPRGPTGSATVNVPTETPTSFYTAPSSGVGTKFKPSGVVSGSGNTSANVTGNVSGSGTNSSNNNNSNNNNNNSTSNGGAHVAGSGVGINGNGATGRNSSLAQRRAQFQANRQNSEAHDRRHPPLVRALSAPIRPADPDTSKFLQGKKKPRRRKVLREKDEYNICEEDEFSDDGDCKASTGGVSAYVGAGATNTTGTGASAAGAAGGKPFPSGLPMRSRSVLGGACDIETLVSLLSSGGSDSEKEQDQAQSQLSSPSSPPPAVGSTTFRSQQPFPSGHLPAKGRAPMLKKAGKSVSFQETDLKPSQVATAGLNRDYRKPTFQSTVANRMRRTQQLVSTLNAFQLKDKERDRNNEKDGGEEKLDRPASATNGKEASGNGETSSKSTTSGASKTESNKSTTHGDGAATANGDLQTPKEQECYRLFLKMSKKGLAVSYDTILRGMLTPTELRVLQKKKNREQSSGAETGDDCAVLPIAEDTSPESGSGDVDDSGVETFERLTFGRNLQRPEIDGQQEDPSTAPCDDRDSDSDDEENTS